MKISYNWLKQYLVTDLEPHELFETLTDIGLEVESHKKSQTSNPLLNNVVLGKIHHCQEHPGSDRLRVVLVAIGKPKKLKIVCGASNVAANQKVLIAMVNACLFDKNGNQIRIQKTNIRGIESEGMICSAKELGLEESSEGILLIDNQAPPGTPASELFKIDNDYLIEIGLTPNRSDAMGHWGVARDLYAALKARGHKAELSKPKVEDFKPEEHTRSFRVDLRAPDQCIRYSGCLIRNVEIAPSPFWLQKRLQTLGLPLVNNVVDVTNFVMHELGQPLYAYDADCIQGNEIYIKTSGKEQLFKTLDSIERTIEKEDLVICDAQKPLSIAGVMGGLNSSVTKKTQTIFLESACFDPVSIRQSAKRKGLSTDASFRFERQTDPEQVLYALKRAALLIKEVAKGNLSPPVDLYPAPIKPAQIKLRYEKVNHLLGETLAKDQIQKILSLLEINILSQEKESLTVSVPTYRVDVTREVDLIEEILRIHGYNLIKTPENFRFSLNSENKSIAEKLEQNSSKILNALGFYETIHTSLTHKKYQKFMEEASDQAIELLNPLSNELAMLRQSLLFGLIECIFYNINRKNTSMKFFEWGKIYNKKKAKYTESYCLSLVTTDKESEKEHWLNSSYKSSFFQLKGTLEALLKKNRIRDFKQQPIKHSLLDQSLLLIHEQIPLAVIGSVKRKILKEFNIDQDIFYAEIQWESLVNHFQKDKIRIQKLPKYPHARRDLAILLDESVTFEALYENIQRTKEKLLKTTKLFDVYTGNRLPRGKKSYALGFYLEDPEQTLTDDRIEKAMENIRNTLRKTLGAEFR